MKLRQEKAQVFIPGGMQPDEALRHTTHLAIGAHQDDLEIMAVAGILECFQDPQKGFSGVVCSDGSGSPRDGLYAQYTNAQMIPVRNDEQKKAAVLGEYLAQIILAYPSAVIKDGSSQDLVQDISQIVQAASANIIYTHNLADKHETHVAVALRTISAIRMLPAEKRPSILLGCEVWRNLDWLLDEDKVVSDVSQHENLQAALLGVFDSQISGGKRYDLATLARRRANATFFQSHQTDISTGLTFAMDLTPLIKDPELDIQEYVQGFINRFADQVKERLDRMQTA